MKKSKKYSALVTEQNNPRTSNLDRISLKEVLIKINYEDSLISKAVKKSIPQIEKAAKILSKTHLEGGKIFFMGAGTSGRLGVLEAAELAPTFGVKPKNFIPIMAGGKYAVFLSKEGAEDIFKNGYNEIFKKIKPQDMLIGIAASGITPYVKGGIQAANKKGAKTALITLNFKDRTSKADIIISANIGPEPIAGSTRMKSGTATKLMLNMLTTSAMIISGKVYKNWMVDVKPTSRKLLMRAERITALLGKTTEKEARKILKKTAYNVKQAIIMSRLKVDLKQAKQLLIKHKGFLKNIIE
ncbi:MAG: N-acetylmuramic acid 6-phosphate etherase [Elusimicrobiales bacterium]|nr:N-acetylmuramic acid 6-phosphate etherase [Elusimicrobiales bacterium]MCK5582594.1 N-acetylmuramic acid 6-phosphate etherase [Elusimicrobiales bacterium]